MALVTEEKETDVNMGAHLVWDACHRVTETALVVSNDSDLQTPITMAMALGMEVIVVNPHRHKQQRIHLSGSDRRNIRRSHLVAAQLPEIVQARDGLVRRPAEWA